MPLLLLVLSFHLILCPPEMADSDIFKTKIMASGPITSWQINGETMEIVTDFSFLGSKITADDDCSHAFKRLLLLERKAMTNLAAKPLQSCPTLCGPIDGSPPGSLVPGILQTKILEWVAISFSRGYSQPRDQTHVFRIAGRRFTV